jgi:hypothetical protein
MTKPHKYSDDQFIKVWMELKSAAKVSRHLGMDLRGVNSRRVKIQSKYGITLPSTHGNAQYKMTIPEDKVRIQVEMSDGVFVVFSDAHYFPGLISTAHRALCKLLPTIKPRMLIANGDILDGTSISSHARIGYEARPTVQQELEAVQERLGELEKACKGGNTKFLRTIGNHCVRFDSKLSGFVPQYEGVKGFTLDDHLPGWKSCWSVMINDDVMVKHRWHNGVHATYNNILKGGTSFFTGHLHALGMSRWSDYNGTRYGVDTGTLADPWGSQFGYMEDNPRNWRQGFAVGTIKDGKLMPPELCEVIDEDHVWWRGEKIKV